MRFTEKYVAAKAHSSQLYRSLYWQQCLINMSTRRGLIGWIEIREVNEHSTILSMHYVPINSANNANLRHYL